MKRYVLGFAFTEDKANVALVMKNRPAWQAGKLNGIGGHVEPSDVNDAHAMSREFFEETGVHIHSDNWEQYCVMQGFDAGKTERTFQVVVFRTFTDAVMDVKTMTDEEIILAPVRGVRTGVKNQISNIPWLIAMALDQNYGHPFTSVVEYKSAA